MDTKHTLQVFAAIVAGATLAFGAGKLMPDGSNQTLTEFGCHVEAKECRATVRVRAADGNISDRLVRFTFDGKIKDDRGRKIVSGRVPADLTACVTAFKSGKFANVVDLSP